MLDTENYRIAVASIMVVSIYITYLVRSQMWRDIIAPHNMERNYSSLASVIVVTAAFGMVAVVIIHFSHRMHFNRMYIWLMLAWLAVEVTPDTLLNAAKKLDITRNETHERHSRH